MLLYCSSACLCDILSAFFIFIFRIFLFFFFFFFFCLCVLYLLHQAKVLSFKLCCRIALYNEQVRFYVLYFIVVLYMSITKILKLEASITKTETTTTTSHNAFGAITVRCVAEMAVKKRLNMNYLQLSKIFRRTV